MMNTNFGNRKFQAIFTSRIMEVVKRMRIRPAPRMTEVPWGLLLTAGIILTVLGLNPQMSISDPADIPVGSLPLVEANILAASRPPADILAASQLWGRTDNQWYRNPRFVENVTLPAKVSGDANLRLEQLEMVIRYTIERTENMIEQQRLLLEGLAEQLEEIRQLRREIGVQTQVRIGITGGVWPQQAIMPVTGEVSGVEEGEFMLLDLSNLYTRPHNSMQIGGGDNASFSTWFDKERYAYKGIPFRVKYSGNDVVVSPNNTQNHLVMNGLGIQAKRIHLLAFGYCIYDMPPKEMPVIIHYSDGVSERTQFKTYEWSGIQLRGEGVSEETMGDVAFNFESTIGFPHAAITYHVIELKHHDKPIESIESKGTTFGLVAVTLEK